MKHINSNDDARFVLTLTNAQGQPLDAADCDFSAMFWTRRYAKHMIHYRSGEATPPGVTIDTAGKVVITLDSPRFAPGEIFCEVVIYIPDEEYRDGSRAESSGEIHTNVYVDAPVHSCESKAHHGCSGDVNVEVSFGDGDGGSVDIQPIPNTVIDAICV